MSQLRSRSLSHSCEKWNLISSMRVSQLASWLTTKVRPPTAATSGEVKRHTSSRSARRSTTTSESTERMSSDSAARTARLIPLRLPWLVGFCRTDTLGCPSAARRAQSRLSSCEQSSTTMMLSRSAG